MGHTTMCTGSTDVVCFPTIPVNVTTIAQVSRSRETPDRSSWCQVKAGCKKSYVAQFAYGHSVCPKPDWYELEERLDIQLAQEYLNGATLHTFPTSKRLRYTLV
jgi:hypothetical protein